MYNSIIIGICGGSASGKTTIVNKLKDRFNNDLLILAHDDYYKKHKNMTYEEREKLNFDHPNAFDTDLLISHIKELKKGNTIESPIYDYTIHNRIEKTILVKPKSIILVEGILILENKELRDLFDIKIFVDTDSDERLMRRIQRDVTERGRSLESVINQYRNTVKPMHDIFIEPSKKYADIIIPYGGKNLIAMEFLIDSLDKYIKNNC